MDQKKETLNLFLELQTLEERGVGIWMEGCISSPQDVAKSIAVNEDSIYMRDYIFDKGVLQEIHFDKVTDM